MKCFVNMSDGERGRPTSNAGLAGPYPVLCWQQQAPQVGVPLQERWCEGTRVQGIPRSAAQNAEQT